MSGEGSDDLEYTYGIVCSRDWRYAARQGGGRMWWGGVVEIEEASGGWCIQTAATAALEWVGRSGNG